MSLTTWERKLFTYSLVMLAMLTGVFTWSALGLLVKIPVTLVHFPLGSLLTLVILYLASQNTCFRLKWYDLLWVLLIYAGLVIGFAYVADLIWDRSVDGRWYHSEGIMRLAYGWNPIYDTITESHPDFTIYVKHYPKSEWLIYASLERLFGSLEKAKLFHFVLHTLILSLSMVFFKKLFAFRSYFLPVLGSLLLACNPVVLAQSFSFYNDGDLGLGMIGVVMICFFYTKAEKKDRPFLYAALFPLLAYTAHIKYTGLVYLAFMLFFFLLLYTWQGGRKALGLLGYLSVSLVLIVGLIGFHPLISNTLVEGNPFYPLLGEEAVDIMESNTPKDMVPLNTFEKFLTASLADPAGNRTGNVDIHLTSLFSSDDLSAYAEPDPRQRGFGLYSPLILLFLLLAIPYALVNWPRKTTGSSNNKSYVIFIYLIFLAIAILSKEIWWARYIAYLWFFIPLTLCSLAKSKRFPALLLGASLVMATSLNASHFTANFFHYAHLQDQAERDLLLYNLTAPPEETNGKINGKRYSLVYTYAYWYQDKIETLGITNIEPKIIPAYTREEMYPS